MKTNQPTVLYSNTSEILSPSDIELIKYSWWTTEMWWLYNASRRAPVINTRSSSVDVPGRHTSRSVAC